MRKTIAGIAFEWDDEKEKLNDKKHGVDFDMAARVFFDPYHIELPDEAHSDYETRYKVLGMVENLLLVICTDRDEATRIISARKATAKEGRIYNGNRA
ncbi:MAG: BrnT family toxin [Schwartzia sp.]|nr:BrnT family toxin [Schwartzia sp. (in: firmicutes)]